MAAVRAFAPIARPVFHRLIHSRVDPSTGLDDLPRAAAPR